MTFSSDLVFDGREGPYCETDRVNPTSVYGRSKAEAEYRVLAAGNKHLLIRTAAFFGAWDSYNFAWSTLNHLAGGRTVRACPNSMVSPTFVPDLCHAALDLLLDGETGRSEEHTSELQSLMRISYAVFCLKKKKQYAI